MSLLVVGLADPMWLPVDLVLAALLSSAFELAWVAERWWAFGRRRSFRPRHRLLLRTGAGAITRAGVFSPRRVMARARSKRAPLPGFPCGSPWRSARWSF